MDSSDERSLPMSKWMRRTERADFIDMCASSPPSDGFFHPNHSKINTKNQSGCDQPRRNSGAKSIPQIDSRGCSTTADHSGFFKSISAPGNYPSMTEGNGMGEGKLSLGLEKWAKANIRGTMEIIYASEDTAPTPIDHLPQYQRIIPMITKSEESSGSGQLRLVDRLTNTPDITPCTTPSVTPAHSPMVLRKSNPFFSGDANRREEGSWLFRAGPQNQGNMLYQANVEMQQAKGTQPSTQTVRHVPKPSQLRELNFFSPTSM